jgi:hypothetical protein
MKFGTLKDGRDYLDDNTTWRNLCYLAKSIIKHNYTYILGIDLCRIQHAHILAQSPKIIIPNKHKLHCTSSKATMHGQCS